MFAVVINEKGGQPRRQEFAKSELTIGRVQGNDIILPKQNVSKRHSRIVLKDGKFIIVDLKSTNGTYVNGRKIASPMVIKSSDKVYIGDFIITVEALDGSAVGADDSSLAPSSPPSLGAPTPAPEPPPAPKAPPPPPPRPKPATLGPSATPAPVPAPVAAPAPPPPAPAPPPPAPPPPAPRPVAAPVPMPAPAPRPVPVPVPAPVPAPRPATAAPVPVAQRPLAAPTARPVEAAHAAPAAGGLHERVFARLEEQHLAVPATWSPGVAIDDALLQRAESVASELLRELGGDTSTAAAVASEVVGVGPLARLFADASVRRILVNGADAVRVVRGTGAEEAGVYAFSASGIALAADRLLRAAGAPQGASGAFAEGVLADGTRVHWASAAVGGPFLTIDRPSGGAVTLDQLAERGTLSTNTARFFELAMRVGTTVVVSSNCVDARFEFMSALANAASGLRVVAVEGGGRVAGSHAVTLSGAPGVDNSALIQHALKMRPDRLLIADCRGPEALAALSALSGGVNGGAIGLEGTTVDEAPTRLLRLAAMAGAIAPERLDALLNDSPRVLVQLQRQADGSVRVTQVSELAGGQIQDVYGLGGRATGHTPVFAQQAAGLGHAVDAHLFR